jgi:regulator of protease activity HflC (stomatin/prohibitin superfamily)
VTATTTLAETWTLAQAAAPAPVGKAPDLLPALRIEVTGAVTASNLAEFKATALATIRAVNRTLKTDQDFADADKAVKWCADVESRLKAAKEHALSQTADIEALFRALDEIGAEAKTVRLDLDKLVTRRKTEVKEEAVAKARRALDEHVAGLNAEIAPMRITVGPVDFAGAIKGLRSIASMQDALDTALAGGKIAADGFKAVVRGNVATFQAEASGFEFLFADLGALVHKAADDFKAVVSSRIATHKANEERKAREKAEAEARAAEAARVAQEAAARAAAEASAKASATTPAPAPAPMVAAPVSAPPAPAPATTTPRADEPATLELGDICGRLGFTVTAAFVGDTLHIPSMKTEGNRPGLYTERQFALICLQLQSHVSAMAELYAGETA